MEGRTVLELRLQVPKACSGIPSDFTYKTQIQKHYLKFQDNDGDITRGDQGPIFLGPYVMALVTSPCSQPWVMPTQ